MGLAVFFAGVAIPLHVTFAQGSCTNPIDTNESDCISNGAQWIPAGGGGCRRRRRWRRDRHAVPPAAAAPSRPIPSLQDLICYVVDSLIAGVVPLIFALAIVMFVWGVVRYVIGADDEKERERGKQFMIWGIIALAVMVSVWGLVHLVTNTFGLSTGGQTYIPQVRQ